MKSRLAFLLLLAGTALLGIWLRPRMFYELWTLQELESPFFSELPWSVASSQVASGGLGVFDFDGDGWQDLLVSRPLPIGQQSVGPGLLLFRNLGTGRFVDVSRDSGLRVVGPCHGLGVGDFDEDGDADVFVAGKAENHLWINTNGRFRDATVEWGLSGSGRVWGSVTVADFDRDGRLDLGVAPRIDASKGQFITLFLQTVHGKFSPTVLDLPVPAAGIAVLDADSDGWQDLFVFANFQTQALFFGNGTGNFRRAAETGLPNGGARGAATESRGIDWGDLDGDGFPEIVVASPIGEQNLCLSADAQGLLRNVAGPNGLADDSGSHSGWGVELFDVDNDGDLDVFIAHGEPTTSQRVPPQGDRPALFLNQGAGHYQELGGHFGAVMIEPRDLRGAISADLDRDSMLDLVLSTVHGPPVILWNRLQYRPWLRLRLRPDSARSVPRSPPEGLGARVEIEASSRSQVRWMQRTAGYLSSQDAVVHFGLDGEDRVERLRILWPSGQVDVYKDIETHREYLAHEGRDKLVTISPEVTADS